MQPATHYAAKVDTGPHSPRHRGMQSGEVCTPCICPVSVGPLFCMTNGLITMEPRAQDPPWWGGDDLRNISDHVFLVLSESIHFQTYKGYSSCNSAIYIFFFSDSCEVISRVTFSFPITHTCSPAFFSGIHSEMIQKHGQKLLKW